jgi:hypothetical protein
MPERELSEQVRRRLSAALDAGSPLVAPLPSQARFATLQGATPSPRWKLRALTVAAAAAGIAVVAFAGSPQPRQWVVQTVNGITKQVGIPAGSVSPSPRDESTTSGQQKENEPTESPEAPEATQEPRESPEPAESPDGDDTLQTGPGQPQPSPTAESSDGGGGGDHSPEPTPSSSDGGSDSGGDGR